MPDRTIVAKLLNSAICGPAGQQATPANPQISWLDLATSDADHAASIQRQWMPIEYDQIDGGAFAGRFQQLEFQGTLVSTEQQNRAVIKRHYFPADYCTVSLVRSTSGQGRCGLDTFSGRTAAYMPGDTDYEIVMPASDVVFFRLRQDRFLSVADVLGYDIPGSGRQALLLDSRDSGFLDDMASTLISIQHSPAAHEFAALDHAYLDDVVIERLIEAVADSDVESRSTVPVGAHRITKAAHELIEDCPDEPYTVMALCEKLGASRASLQRGFLQTYGISPLAYLRMRRLNCARRALKAAHGSGATVAAIAMHWGFFHFARFSQDYFQQFGELPSTTLGKAGKTNSRAGR